MMALPDFGLGTIATIGVFLGVLLAFEGLRQVLTRSEDAGTARNRRMKMIAGGASTEDVLRLLKPTAPRWSLYWLPFVGSLPVDMRQAGIALRPTVYLAGCLALAALITLAGMAKIGLAGALGIGLMLGVGLPVTIVRRMQKKRMELLTQQLPEALELMARGLRVGHPINTTISSVAQDMADPIASEFGVMVDQIAYGEDIATAFAAFAGRIDTDDARYLATSVAIQNGTGGDLSRILVTLSKVIRGRIIMRKRIMAISSEGRLTAVFLSCLPLFILSVTTLISPTYYWGISDDPAFKPLAGFLVFLTVGNFLAMRRLVKIRI